MTNGDHFMNNQKIARYLYLFWVYTLLVIVWGAWVRISHSGNGCGDHWPLCQGDIIPDLTDKKTFTEYSHRIMSGLYGILAFVIYWVFRKKMYSENTRKLGLALLIFTIIEALVGALLVKQSLVTVNDSIFRLVVMGLHQINSFLLTGTAFLLYLSVKDNIRLKWTPELILFMCIVAAGAIASLSNTLFPSENLMAGIKQDFQESAHIFVRLRFIHPVLALSFSTVMIYLLYKKDQSAMAFRFLLAISVGALALLSNHVTFIKLLHLVIAHYLWCSLLKHQLRDQLVGSGKSV